MIGEILIVLSIILIYDLNVGARHILCLIMLNLLLIIYESSAYWSIIFLLICLYSLYQTGNSDKIPYRNASYSEYLDSLERTFSEVVTVTDSISYDNLVAMPTLDTDYLDNEKKVCTYYGLMYAMPAGVGISLDFEDFYQNKDNIKAGYILVHPNGCIRNTLEEIDMHIIFENEEFVLYSK